MGNNFTPAWFKKGFFNESLFCDDFLSTHQLIYVNGAFFTPEGRVTDTMNLRCEIFEMLREYVGANIAKKVSDMVTLLDDVSAAAYDKAVEMVTETVRTETRKEDMRMIEDTKRWVLSPERKAPQATREYTAKHLDGVLNKFLKTMQAASARLQETLLKPEVRQKGKEQVKEKARDSVLQLLNRLQAEQAHKPTVQPRTKGEYSEI